MVKNYIVIALRNLLKHKGFSLISILGLAASMSVCLLIIVFTRQQWKYDGFHEHAEQIFHIYSDYKASINPSSHLYATTPMELGKALAADVPAVDDYATLRRFGGETSMGKQKIDITGYYASEGFFRIFNFPFCSGNAQTALSDPGNIVITRQAAKRLFGDKDPLDQILTIADVGEFKVSGVVETPDDPTLFEFEVIVPLKRLISGENQVQLTPWDRTVRSFYTFVRLRQTAGAADLQQQLPLIIERHFPGDEASHLVALNAQKLRDMVFGPLMDNHIKFFLPSFVLMILGVLAAIILLAACINYISLSVARALDRAREVGVRKVVGAQRMQIVSQFLVEAICIALLALLVACGVLLLLIDGFNNLTLMQFIKSQVIPEFSDAWLILFFVAFAITVGLLTGLYPALYLSSFLPTAVLKGFGKAGGKGSVFRKVLIVSQFTLSLVFIISTILLYQQSRHLVHTDYGFNPQNIINVALQDVDYELLRNELIHQPGVTGVSAVSFVTGSGRRADTWLKSATIAERLKGYSVWVDERFLPNMEIPVIAGRNFTPEDDSEIEQVVLLNETAVALLGYTAPVNAVGQIITIEDSLQVQVIGVVRDYRFYSALTDIDPQVLRFDARQLTVANIRFHPTALAAGINQIHVAWEKFPTDEPLVIERFEHYLSEAMEIRLMRDFLYIIGLAAGFAILIASLGLLGMTTYITRTRIKEIGVRKVFGASTGNILGMLSRSYFGLIAVAILIAVPLAAVVNNLWLANIGNRIGMGAGAFFLGIFVLLLIALATSGSQTIRAARSKPADVLKYE